MKSWSVEILPAVICTHQQNIVGCNIFTGYFVYKLPMYGMYISNFIALCSKFLGKCHRLNIAGYNIFPGYFMYGLLMHSIYSIYFSALCNKPSVMSIAGRKLTIYNVFTGNFVYEFQIHAMYTSFIAVLCSKPSCMPYSLNANRYNILYSNMKPWCIVCIPVIVLALWRYFVSPERSGI